MTSPKTTSRRVSPARIVLGLLLLAGIAAWAWFGGHAYARVKRDQATFARVAQQKPKALLELRADEDARLHAGAVPIEAAMQQLATRGRTGLGSALMPRQSNDTAPLMGWAFQPHDVPEWMMLAPAPADAGAPVADGPSH